MITKRNNHVLPLVPESHQDNVMNFKISSKLIHEAETPKGLLYRSIIVYVFIMVGLLFSLYLVYGNTGRLNFYFFINTCTVSIMTWVIRKSFNIKSEEEHLAVFRIGLFLLVNSSLASMAGGLALLERDVASLIAAVMYMPAILLIVFSFNKFIKYVNYNYESVVSMSFTDELTGLPNRRHLNSKLREMEGREGIICIADIDHFKKINDTYGHEMGDNVLRKTGIILRGFTSEEVFISRSGGEEFVIVVFDTLSAEGTIKKIKTSLTDVCNGSMQVTLSIGVASKRSAEPPTSAIKAADEALYRAKRAGRNCIIHAPEHRNF